MTQPLSSAERLGFGCAVVALILFPPFFALIVLLIGISSCLRSRFGPGIALIVLSPIVFAIGATLGAIAGGYYY